jgi:hypothetical protein
MLDLPRLGTQKLDCWAFEKRLKHLESNIAQAIDNNDVQIERLLVVFRCRPRCSVAPPVGRAEGKIVSLSSALRARVWDQVCWAMDSLTFFASRQQCQWRGGADSLTASGELGGPMGAEENMVDLRDLGDLARQQAERLSSLEETASHIAIAAKSS